METKIKCWVVSGGDEGGEVFENGNDALEAVENYTTEEVPYTCSIVYFTRKELEELPEL